MLKLIKYTYIPIIISLIIFYLCCLIAPNDVPDVEIKFFIPTDKVVHFLMYFGLSGATAINYLYLNNWEIKKYKLLIGAFAIPIIYRGLIELLQYYYFPPRSGDWFDFLADILGSLAALPVVLFFRNYVLKKMVSKEQNI